MPEPVAGQPFDRPFAFALVTLDGADAPFLHALDVASPDEVAHRDAGPGALGRRAGRRTSPTSRASSRPLAEAARRAATRLDASRRLEHRCGPGHRASITPVELDYLYAASPEESPFYRGLAEGRLLGQRCPTCRKVYVPPRSACPADGTPTAEEVELPDKGTVTTFCIVNVPFLGQRITPPYVSAYVLLDGADIAFLHLILDVPAEEVRMGMRVEAVWKPREEWGTTIENISHFAPTGEPDADYETYSTTLRGHL